MMATVYLPEELLRKLKAIARQENRPVPEVLSDMVEEYQTKTAQTSGNTDPLEKIIGIFDDDITDLSMTVRETLQEYFRKKYGSTD